MTSQYAAIIDSPLGHIGFVIKDNKLTLLEILAQSVQTKIPHDSLSRQIADELAAYFKNPQHVFSLPLELSGSVFQNSVWRALKNIPSGETLTYGALAERLQSSPRAIGQACRTNPIPIIIPCHRIIAANHLGGYAGATNGSLMDVKKWLLTHEGVHINR